MRATRREFLSTTIGGIALTVSQLVPRAGAQAMSSSPPDWQAGPGQARFRIDGLRKVTGQKTYARDYRARDIEGWPREERVVLVVRAPRADRIYLGLDLGRLPGELQPTAIVTAEDLARDHVGIARTDYPEGDYLVTPGHAPDYLGQEVALLFYDDYLTMDRARRAIRSDVVQCVAFGAEVPPRPETYFSPETHIVHVRDAAGKEVFSQMGGGPVDPDEGTSARDVEALGWVDRIASMLDDPAAQGWTVFRRSYETQVIDPMFMEPESGLAWLDRDSGTLHLMIGSQSPSYDANAALQMLSGPLCTLGVKTVNFISAFPGGGFGGRDTSMLCLFLSLAAAYSDRPIRIVNDRFEQFQSGIKRHASRCDVTLAVEPDGKFAAVRNYIDLNGGGRINVSAWVAQVAALAGTGPYGVPLADIWSRAARTRSITAGSMRGFGAVQSQFAIESLVDEIAAELGMDAIALRRLNALHAGQDIDTGAAVAPPGLVEMCDIAADHRLWRERGERRAASDGSPVAYGVGFALAMKNYGTGADAALDEVAIAPDGRITVTTNVIDMGSGTATTLAIATARMLGANASEVLTGQIAPFAALRLEEGWTLEPDNPRWTPIAYESTKASATSSRWVHGVEQAAAVVLATGLLPAARELWSAAVDEVPLESVAWVEGALGAPGRTPIPLADLARRAHDRGHVVSAMIHAFFSARWIEADYTVGDATHRWPIDALSVLRGGRTERELIDRKNPKLFTVQSMWEGNGQEYGATACLAAVEVDRRTGETRLKEAVQFIGPGRILQRDLLEGQLEGCFAMGVGQALIEDLPAYEDGAGDGLWNLHLYHVPLSADVALGRVEQVILPQESESAPARGIAELAMIAVPPAIGNAVAHATGTRPRRLPITAESVRAAWRG